MKPSILITGGAAGIGAATVRRFAAEGWNVLFTDIDASRGHALEAATVGSIFVEADTRSLDALKAAAAIATERFGRIDALFANAGIHRKNTVLDITDDEFDLVVKTNIYGTANTLRAVVPAIIASGGGSVVLNASDQSFIGKRASFAYGLTKGAIAQMAKSTALDLAPHRVRVNAVCPGTVRTAIVDGIFGRLSAESGRPVAEYFADEAAEFPLGRICEPEEVASLVYFLASDESGFITGSLFPIDGGITAG